MGHRVYESMAGFLAEMSRKVQRHPHPEESPERAGGKVSPPSAARRVLVKAQAVIIFLYIAAKKKCIIGSKDGERMMSSADHQSHGGQTSPSPMAPVRKALGKARAVIILTFVAAKKKLVDVRNKERAEERERKESPELDTYDDSGIPCGGSKLSSPASTPIRRAIGKARAAVASSYRAAKKKAGRKNKSELADQEEMSASDAMSVSDGEKLSPATKHSPLGTVKAAVYYTILHARKKKHATAAATDDHTTIPSEREEEPEHEFSNSPGSMHSTPKSSMAKTPKSTPSRSPKALFRKVQAAAVLLPFHSRKKASDRPAPEEDLPPPRESASTDGVVWKKTILMGQKCEPLDFPETIPFDIAAEDTDHDFSVTASPASMYSTQTLSVTPTPDATPTRTTPKAVLRKVKSAAVLLPFHSRKKYVERPAVAAEAEEDDYLPPPPKERSSFEGVVWKKTILMGQKCEPLDFPGVIYYDSKGGRVDGAPLPRSPLSAVQQQVGRQQQQQQGAFSFPVLVAGSEVNDR